MEHWKEEQMIMLLGTRPTFLQAYSKRVLLLLRDLEENRIGLVILKLRRSFSAIHDPVDHWFDVEELSVAQRESKEDKEYEEKRIANYFSQGYKQLSYRAMERLLEKKPYLEELEPILLKLRPKF